MKKGNFFNLRKGWVGAVTVVVEEESFLVCFAMSSFT
jgi:hypothetical protein